MTTQYRSSRPEVFSRKEVLKNFSKFPGKHLCQSLVFNKIAGLRSGTLFKKETLSILRKLFRTPFLPITDAAQSWPGFSGFFIFYVMWWCHYCLLVTICWLKRFSWYTVIIELSLIKIFQCIFSLKHFIFCTFML